ncbi:MAG: hypothetical protein Q8P52_00545 [bacterium]|nr:hypothetical protein [bacterium]
MQAEAEPHNHPEMVVSVHITGRAPRIIGNLAWLLDGNQSWGHPRTQLNLEVLSSRFVGRVGLA